MTMTSESVASLFSVCDIEIISAIGAMTRIKCGDDETGDAEEGHDGLTLARHEVDAAQRLGNPDHAGEADQDHHKRRKRRAEYIPVDRPHRYRTIPNSQPNARPATSRFRVPNGCAASRPAGLVSHYHPVDPSTKWPRDGTSCQMVNNSPAVAGRPRRAWQRRAGQVIVPNRAASAAKDDIPSAVSAGFDPAIALIFWRNCPCPTPSRSASSRCPQPPAASSWCSATIR